MKIKRPLCLICLALTAAVWIFLKVIPVPEPDYYQKADGSMMSFTGEVIQKEYRMDFTGKKIPVLYLQSASDRESCVQCYMDTGQYREPFLGETVQMSGRFKNFYKATNPGEFDSRQYYSILKIQYQMKDAFITASDHKKDGYREKLYHIRCYMSSVLDHCLNPQDASIMKAMLLGDKTDMDADIKELYKKSGIIHILAISGLHISIIGMGLFRLLRRCRLGVLPATLFCVGVMWSYGIMTGMSTSAFRAILMFAVHLTAGIIGRTYDMLTGLALAAILLLADQPLYVFHSGFLMSFGAIIGIGLILPEIRPMHFVKSEKYFNGLFSSIAVSLITLPIYTNFYYTFPVYAMFLNVLVLPLMTAVMIAGLLCLLIGGVFGIPGVIPGWIVHFMLLFYEKCCLISQNMPGNTWYIGHTGTLQMLLYMLLLVFFTVLTERLRKKRRTLDRRASGNGWTEAMQKERKMLNRYSLLRYLILPLAVLMLTFRIHPPVRLTFLDVGQGDGIVIESGGETYLIDGGSTSKKEVGKYQLIPFLSYEGIGALDAVILTHEDEDHMSGILELMAEIPKGGIKIRHLILPDIAEAAKGENYRRLEQNAAALKIPIDYIGRGDEIRNRRLYMKCIGPQKKMNTDQPNAYSTVLYLQCGNFSAMLTGDTDGEGQEALKDYLKQNPEFGKNLTLLKVAHHGSRFTTDADFLKLCRPQYAVISCGERNKYGHPHKELLKRLADARIKVFITKDSGAVTFDSDGYKMKIREFLTPDTYQSPSDSYAP